MIAIERKSLNVPEIADDLRVLAERAKSELGYDGLLKQSERPLAKVLIELDIQPFTPSAVADYKAKRLAEATQSLDVLKESYRRKVKRNRSFLAAIGLRAQQAITVEEREAYTVGTRFEWVAASLSNYHGQVPEFVVSKALEIKSRLPEAQFGIDYLRYHYDPFLTVQHGEECYHVEVWNEPKFEESLLTKDDPNAFSQQYFSALRNMMGSR